MSAKSGGIHFAAVSVCVIPLFLLAAVTAQFGTQFVATLSLEQEGQAVTASALQSWAQEHLLVAALFNALVLIPGALLLARRGAGLSWAEIGFSASRPLRSYAIGVALGALLLLTPAALGYAIGGFTPIDRDAGVAQGLAALPQLSWMLPALVVAAFAEELVLRGFLLRLWHDRLGKWIALSCTSGLFALLHLGNPDASVLGAIGALVAGFWLGLAFLETRSLLHVAGLHLGWNAAIALILGLPVSGLALPALMRWLPSADTKSQLLWGGGYGPEEGLVFHLTLLLGAVSYLRWGRQLNPRSDS